MPPCRPSVAPFFRFPLSQLYRAWSQAFKLLQAPLAFALSDCSLKVHLLTLPSMPHRRKTAALKHEKKYRVLNSEHLRSRAPGMATSAVKQ